MAETKRTITIYINGKEVENSIKGIKTEMAKAQAEIKKMTIGTIEYENKAKEIAQLKSVITQHNANLKQLEQGWTAATNKQSLFTRMLISTKAKMVEWGGAAMAAFSFYTVFNFFKTGTEGALKMRDSETLLLHALKGREDIQKKLLAQADELAKNTTQKRADIIEAQEYLALQGRSEEQIKKTMQAAAELSAVTGGSLMESMKTLDATMEGKLGKSLPKMDDAFKNMTTQQLKSGEAIDLVISKYGGLAKAMTETTEGKIIMAQKSWAAFKRTLGEFILLIADKLVPIFTTGMNKLKEFGGWLKENSAVVIAVSKAVGILIVSLVTYYSTTALLNTLTKAWIITQKIYSGVVKLLRGEITLATIAQKSFNTAQKMNPVGIILSVLAAAVTAYMMFGNKINDAIKSQHILNDMHKEFADQLATESAKMNLLFDTLKKDTTSKESKVKLIKQINEEYGKYLPKLLTEKSTLEDITTAQTAANTALEKNILLKVNEETITKLVKEKKNIEDLIFGYKLYVAELEKAKKAGYEIVNYQRGYSPLETKALNEAEGVDPIKYYKDLITEEQNALKTNASLTKSVFEDYSKTLNEITSATTTSIEENLKDVKDMTLEELKTEQERLEVLGDDQGKANMTRLAAVKRYITAKEKLINKDADNEEKAYDKIIEKSKSQEDELALYLAKVKDEILTDSQGANAKELKDIEDKYLDEIYQLKKYQTENDKLIAENNAQLLLLKGKENTEENKALQTHITNLTDLNKQAAETEKQLVKDKDDAIASAVAKQTAAQLEKQKEHLSKVAELNGAAIDDELNNLQDKYTKELTKLQEGYNANKTYYKNNEEAYQQYLTAIDNLEKSFNADKNYLLKIRQNNDYYADELIAVKGNATKEYQIKREQLQAEADLIDENQAGIDQKLIERKKELNRELLILDKDYIKTKKDYEIQNAQTVSNALYDISKQELDFKLNKTLEDLNIARDKELANQNLTEAQKLAIEKKYAEQERLYKHKDWDTQHTADIIKITIDTALATMKAYSDSGPWGAVAAGITGAAELAVVIDKKNPYKTGGDTGSGSDDDIAGIVHKNEYVIPAWERAMPEVAAMENIIENIRKNRGRPRYISDAPATPAFNEMTARNTSSTASSKTSYTSDNTLNKMLGVFTELKDYMKDPKNRRAKLVRDELTRFDDEDTILKSLAEIK